LARRPNRNAFKGGDKEGSVAPLAEDKLESYLQSWLAREPSELVSPGPPAIEPPRMQRKVFDLFCRKQSTAEIAQTLGLSQRTVRNNHKALFRA
jgi:DNA-binding NarL/FixJ family response regulator